MAEWAEWKCSGCGKPGLERSCECVTDIVCRVSGEKHEHAVKTTPEPKRVRTLPDGVYIHKLTGRAYRVGGTFPKW